MLLAKDRNRQEQEGPESTRPGTSHRVIQSIASPGYCALRRSVHNNGSSESEQYGVVYIVILLPPRGSCLFLSLLFSLSSFPLSCDFPIRRRSFVLVVHALFH
ncbi:hypothetical protein BO94DRAFT_246036 [Aspergillus sclerotioniger CBS 115572]|uniref:Uncharacterized protein n=1 Tax=Aspergillus sclerotioniger CBS 115572 TaxID=1450535 RepID=A0A317VDQ5_9EURO|nr:hypothetical protein BO94DRAFT_246036 [Aspergillus sclerotioniger CBS 115572]PWY72503.1 hypothetical protein BO94DRAFT_246036 [Aspergillus sclerotioniger CBS 115572]